MSDVLLISVFGLEHSDTNSRLESISTYIHGKKSIVTTDFDHCTKKYWKSFSDHCHYIHVPFYKKNISLKRLYSHIVFAYRLKKYLNNLSCLPSCIYCAMPTTTAAYIAGRFCQKKKIKFVIDVIDLWPDSLLPISNRYKYFDPFLFPWRSLTRKVYGMADIIIGESRQYVKEAAQFNSKATMYCAYIGVDMNKINKLIENTSLHINKPDDELWIAYGGNLGNSYDFEELIKSVAILNGKIDYKLWFVGDGVNRIKVEGLLSSYHVNGEITGFLSYGDYLAYLSSCDIAINIFKDDTKVVHSYKFNDYVATNCFILNSLKGETAEMILKYKIGLNFDFKDHLLTEVLCNTVNHWSEYKHWGMNNQRLVKEVLDKKLIYKNLVAFLS